MRRDESVFVDELISTFSNVAPVLTHIPTHLIRSEQHFKNLERSYSDFLFNHLILSLRTY